MAETRSFLPVPAAKYIARPCGGFCIWTSLVV